MITSSINFNDKKSDFYNKNKKIFNIDQSLKEKHTANIIHLNTLLGIMITGLLGHYIYLFRKRIYKFDKDKTAMSLMIKDIQLFKKYKKIWKKN